jgi:hypothetical protein
MHAYINDGWVVIFKTVLGKPYTDSPVVCITVRRHRSWRGCWWEVGAGSGSRYAGRKGGGGREEGRAGGRVGGRERVRVSEKECVCDRNR